MSFTLSSSATDPVKWAIDRKLEREKRFQERFDMSSSGHSAFCAVPPSGIAAGILSNQLSPKSSHTHHINDTPSSVATRPPLHSNKASSSANCFSSFSTSDRVKTGASSNHSSSTAGSPATVRNPQLAPIQTTIPSSSFTVVDDDDDADSIRPWETPTLGLSASSPTFVDASSTQRPQSASMSSFGRNKGIGRNQSHDVPHNRHSGAVSWAARRHKERLVAMAKEDEARRKRLNDELNESRQARADELATRETEARAEESEELRLRLQVDAIENRMAVKEAQFTAKFLARQCKAATRRKEFIQREWDAIRPPSPVDLPPPPPLVGDIQLPRAPTLAECFSPSHDASRRLSPGGQPLYYAEETLEEQHSVAAALGPLMLRKVTKRRDQATSSPTVTTTVEITFEVVLVSNAHIGSSLQPEALKPLLVDSTTKIRRTHGHGALHQAKEGAVRGSHDDEPDPRLLRPLASLVEEETNGRKPASRLERERVKECFLKVARREQCSVEDLKNAFPLFFTPFLAQVCE